MRSLNEKTVLPLFAAGLMAALTLLCTARYGIGVTPDACYYLAGARSFMRTGRLMGVGGFPFMHYAPLLSVLLGAAGLVAHADPRAVAPFVQAVIAGLAVWLACRHLCAHAVTRPARWLGCASVAFAHPLICYASKALSEALFILLLLTGITLLGSFLRRRAAWLWVAAAAAFGLAAITRYIGVALLPVALLPLLLERVGSLRARVARAAGFAAIALAPPCAWYARNYAASGTIAGGWEHGSKPLAKIVADTVSTAVWWLFPGTPHLPALACVPITAAVLAATLWLLLRQDDGWSARRLRAVTASWYLPAALTIGYVLVLWQSMRSVDITPINSRYLTPALLPALMLLALLLDRRMARAPRARGTRLFAGAFAAVAVIFVARSVELTADSLRHGAGKYERPPYRDSRLAAAVRAGQTPGTLFTNDPYMLYFLTGRSVNTCLPRDFDVDCRVTPVRSAGDLAEFMAAQRPAYVIWFDDHRVLPCYTPVQLAPYLPLRLVSTTREGRVYEVAAHR